MPTIRELVAEAEENFGTGRHGNSAQLFKRAGLETLEKGVIDGVYLIYRSLYDMKQANMDLEALQLMRATAFQLIRQIARQSSILLEKGHKRPLDLLELSNEALKILGEEEDRDPVQEMLEQHLFKKFDETKDLKLIERLLEMSSDHRPDLINVLLTQTLIQASEKVHDSAFDGDLVAAAMIIQQVANLKLIISQTRIEPGDQKNFNHILSSMREMMQEPSQKYGIEELILLKEKELNEFEKLDFVKILGTCHHYLIRIAAGEFNANTKKDDIEDLLQRYWNS